MDLLTKVLIYILKCVVYSMKHLKTFEYFKFKGGMGKGVKHYGSAGIVFVYNDMILLVHPTGRGDDEWSFPKGRVDKNEKIKKAALREVEEEIGVKFPKENLKNTLLQEVTPVPKLKGIKHYWYYTYYLSEKEFQKYFGGKLKMDSKNIQLDEIDKARFFTREEAEHKMDMKLLDALNY
jgi:8-oxo-dGTP pyrophosphatase MutT (NUDIX family)